VSGQLFLFYDSSGLAFVLTGDRIPGTSNRRCRSWPPRIRIATATRSIRAEKTNLASLNLVP
jgi:hypothetical protein